MLRNMKYQDKEDDLFEEIYGKFGENYIDLVEGYTKVLLKMNGKEKHRIRDLIAMLLFGFLVGMSFIALFAPLIYN